MKAIQKPVEVEAYQFLGWKEDESGDNAVEVGEKIHDHYQLELIGWEVASIYDPYTGENWIVEIGQWIVFTGDTISIDDYRVFVFDDAEFHRRYKVIE